MNMLIQEMQEMRRQEKLWDRYASSRQEEEEYRKFQKYLGTHRLSMKEQTELADEFLSGYDHRTVDLM